MKKLLFGISLILIAIFGVVLDIGYELPSIVEYVYLFTPFVGLLFCFIGLFEKEE